MRFPFLVFLAFLTFSFSAHAEKTVISQDVRTQEWTSNYYVLKDVSKVDEYLRWIQISRVLESGRNPVLPISAFLATIFAEHPQKIAGWVQGQKFTGAAKLAVERALWLVGQTDLIGYVFHESPDFAQTRATPLQELRPKTQDDLDLMWAAFAASGDPLYVKRVITTADDDTPLTGVELADHATHAAAIWTLGVNMMQHEQVNRIVLATLPHCSSGLQKKLNQILAKNKKYVEKGSFPYRDGDFSAEVLVAQHRAEGEEGEASANLSSVKADQKLEIVIYFAGMDLADDLNANVVAEVSVTDPDGRLWDGFRAQELTLLAGKAATRFKVYTAKPLPLSFSRSDEYGAYTIKVTLRDNVGRKKVVPIKKIVLGK